MLIVSSHFKEDVSWLAKTNFDYLIVSKSENIKNSDKIKIIPNKGNEFGSYLWFIVNYWDEMPEKIAFIHGHENSYHQQYSMPEALFKYKDSDIFCGLNGEFCTAIHNLKNNHPWFQENFFDIWKFLGLDYIAPAPSKAVIQPGTQTIITKDNIKSINKKFYNKIFDIIMSHDDSYLFCLALEVAWQIIFTKNAINNHQYIEEFDSFFESKNLSILIAQPQIVWNSKTENLIEFDFCDSKEDWVLKCMYLMERFTNVSS